MRIAEAEDGPEADLATAPRATRRLDIAKPWIASGSVRMRSTVWRGCSEP